MKQQPKRGAKVRETTRKFKKKTSVLTQEKVGYVDYKDVNLLQRFVSDRSKIRSRRVSGNDVQQQRDIALAVKNSRELALMPYAKRVTTQRTGRPERGSRKDNDYADRTPASEAEVEVAADVEAEGDE